MRRTWVNETLQLIDREEDKNRISYLVNPNLLPELTTDVAKTLDTIEAKGLKTTIAEHTKDLSIL